MRPALKLSSIDQEHLQELYDASGLARDQLPYTDSFDTLCQGFQDRTFKNAHPEQVFAAMIKCVRTGNRPATAPPADPRVGDDQLKQLKQLAARHAKGGRILPYSDEFELLNKEFNKAAGLELSPSEFWQAIVRAQGPKRVPPKRKSAAAAVEESDDSDGE